MSRFEGFSPGKLKATAIPAQFFSEVLPLIDDLAELRVTLFCFWALHQKEGEYRYLREQDFLKDAALMQGLTHDAPQRAPQDILHDALDKACARHTLLKAWVELDSGREALYFVNTERGRVAVRQIQAGQWKPGKEDLLIEVLPERPNIYALYEANIGPLAPMIVDDLKDAERDYPAEWLRAAIQEAVRSNIRSWRYIRSILERWKQEGRSHDNTAPDPLEDGSRYASGKYADWIES